MPPALVKPTSPVLEELEEFADADAQLVIEEGRDFETIEQTVERLIGEIREEVGELDLGRADPPEADWPGRWVDVRDVMLSSGDERRLVHLQATAHRPRPGHAALSSGSQAAPEPEVEELAARVLVELGNPSEEWLIVRVKSGGIGLEVYGAWWMLT